MSGVTQPPDVDAAATSNSGTQPEETSPAPLRVVAAM